MVQALASAGMVIIRKAAFNNVLFTHSFHRTDYDMDHSIVCSKVHL